MIEDLAKCNMKAPFEFTRSYSKARGSGVIELNKMIATEEKLDAIMHRMDNHKKMHSSHEIGALREVESIEVLRDQLMKILMQLRRPIT